MLALLDSDNEVLGARFSNATEIFRARKAIFCSSVSKNGEVYTCETSCMKEISVYIKNVGMKQLYNRKVRDFAMAFRFRKVSGAFEKRAPALVCSKVMLLWRDWQIVIIVVVNQK